ncbi:MFS transporter [Streptomyces montanus]|uniref:MFS transporter n=1 Tax=Streptomyces montanus TaxID=2580423 RepID=UPI001BB2B7BD|nr:MFS transporter [Streptomyces montanus]
MGRARLFALLFLLTLTGFITTLDNTVINVALPTVQRELGLSVTDLEWVASSYVLSFGALLLPGGRLTDLFGRRSVLTVGIVVFTAASAAASLADSGGTLIAARTVQGVGAALVIPASLAVVAADLPARRRSMAIGLWTAALAVALALGPVVGGFVTQQWSWGWVFALNVPFGLIALLLIPSVPARATGTGTGAGAETAAGSGAGAAAGSEARARASAEPGAVARVGSGSEPGPASDARAGASAEPAAGTPAWAEAGQPGPKPRHRGLSPTGASETARQAEAGSGAEPGPGPGSGPGPGPGPGPGFGPGPAPRRRGLDLPGVLFCVVALYLLTYGLVRGGEHGFGAAPVPLCLGVSAVAACVFLVVEARSARPLVELGLLRDRFLMGGVIAQVLWGIGVNGVFFFTALYLQRVLGFSPTKAGLAFLPLAGALLLCTPLAERAARVLGAHVSIAAGLGVVAAGLLYVSGTGAHAGYWELQPGLLLIGAGSALTTPLTVRCLAQVPNARTGMATGLVSAAREVSGVFGVVLVGVVLTRRERSALRSGADPRSAFVEGYDIGLRLAACCVLAGALVTLVTLHRRGRHRRVRNRWVRQRRAPARSRTPLVMK